MPGVAVRPAAARWNRAIPSSTTCSNIFENIQDDILEIYTYDLYVFFCWNHIKDVPVNDVVKGNYDFRIPRNMSPPLSRSNGYVADLF